jgi:hypothetical protein
MVGEPLPLTREDIDDWVTAFLAGTRSRDGLDQRAARWSGFRFYLDFVPTG